MSPGRVVTTLARAVSLLVGVGLLAAGAYGVAVWADHSPAREWSLYLDRDWYYTAPQQSWWPWALLAVAVVAALVGVAVLTATLRPHRAPQTVLSDEQSGRSTVEPGAVCDALAAELATLEGVHDADVRARVLRGHVTYIVEVRPAAETDPDRLRAGIALAAGHVTTVLGAAAPHVRVIVEPAKPERPRAARRGLV